MRFETRPLTPKTWADLEELFGLSGGSIVRGCWCMYYRKTGQVSVSAAAGVPNKEQLCSLVDAGVVPGLVGYVDGQPAGWVSLGKLNNVREAIAIARECRTILGAAGITLEHPVMRHANNLESVLTYEGTSEVHQLVIGQALTGESAFR